MIKHRKIIICILLSYALFIVGIFNVKAAGYYGCYSSITGAWGTNVGFSGGFNICRFDNGNVSSGSSGIIEMYLTEGIEMNGKTTTMVFRNSTGLLITGLYLVDNNDIVSSCELYSTNYTSGVSSYNIICKNVRGIVGNGTKIVAHYLAPQNESGAFVFGISNYLTFDNETQAITNIQNSTNTINSNITDSSIDNNNTSSSTTSWGNKNATNGTITNLLTLPISLLQAIVNGLQSSCSSFSLGSLFGTNIILPCINIGSLVGSTLWTTIDILFSGFMILAIAKKLIKIFNDFTNLKTNQVDELYGGGK